MALPVSIGIVGGMGPWVDPLLLEKLLAYQASLGMRRDQDAIPVLLAQFAPLFADRTEYLSKRRLGGAPENPALAAARTCRMLAAAGARVVGIPCNTFHAPAIFEVFQHEIAPLAREGVEVVHMVRSTCEHIAQQLPAARRVGILSTTGTYLHGIYAEELKRAGKLPVVLPYEEREFSPAELARRRDAIVAGRIEPLQNDVHGAIADPEWGIKSGREVAEGFSRPRAVLRAAGERLRSEGAEALVLACTEIPLALEQGDLPGLPLVDPLEVLARALVDAWRRRFNPAWPAARELPILPG
ncbi:MAG: aspartate/glutamate racemase family protein [Bryobacterales bacterium]|nr:aspartate/glutamate racemase family protein [Bryobacteraceae bacterium]MDW8131433.1 aspartate/glutamate racemase family protein [Bryobacterales bacterium]